MATQQMLQALIYSSNQICQGCPQDIANLLTTSDHNVNVTYVGPDQAVDLDTPGVFDGVAIFAIPGGPNLSGAWRQVKKHQDAVQNFVQNGGRFIGMCLGAYLAGSQDGFNIVPPGMSLSRETLQPGSPISYGSLANSVAQVNWTYHTGPNSTSSSTSQTQQWVFFQDGCAITLAPNDTTTQILGTYASNGNITATLSPYGKGWVGLSCVHVDADPTWYNPPSFTNPDGVQFDLGRDLVNATLNGGNPNSTFVSDVPYTNTTATPINGGASAAPTGASGAPALHPLPGLALLIVMFSWLLNFV